MKKLEIEQHENFVHVRVKHEGKIYAGVCFLEISSVKKQRKPRQKKVEEKEDIEETWLKQEKEYWDKTNTSRKLPMVPT